MSRWQQLFGRMILAFAGAGSGIGLYLALYPGFYYMTWFFFLIMLWALLAVGYLGQVIALQLIALVKRDTLPCLPAKGLGFIIGMLVVVSLLLVFNVPLHASFLLAKPGLEEALTQHHDDLSAVGRVHHNYGLYRFSKADRRCHKQDRVFFQFLHDGEAAIIYSESGLEDLCYNAGSKGHLFGNWYWMKED